MMYQKDSFRIRYNLIFEYRKYIFKQTVEKSTTLLEQNVFLTLPGPNKGMRIKHEP